MKKIVFSHGFGVRADARGMFTDIAAAFPEYAPVMFDYNTLAEDGGVVVSPIDKQVKMLEAHVVDIDEASVLIAHSQGCIVAALAALPRFRNIILLAPPTAMSMRRVIEKMKQRPGAEINLDGMSKYPRSDGTFTYLSKEYIKSLDGIDTAKIYAKLARRQNVTIIRATNDNVLGETNFDNLSGIALIDIAADHDFTGDARSLLVGELRKILYDAGENNDQA